MTDSAAEIAHALGGKRNGCGWLARCCCHDDKTASLSLKDGDSRLLVHCFAGCDVRDILLELRRRGLLDGFRRRDYRPAHRAQPSPIARPANRSLDLVHATWCQAVDPRGTLAERYLNGRRIRLDGDLCGRVLRFHPRCPFGRDELGIMIRRPALVAAFRQIRDDDEATMPSAIHRIALDPDGNKIGKMMLGPVAGCAVKLDIRDLTERNRLGICEGIETGMAIRQVGWKPVWAMGSAGAIAKLEPIPGIEHLTIFADHDANDIGRTAARECGQRWVDAGRAVIIRTPRKIGADWADVLP